MERSQAWCRTAVRLAWNAPNQLTTAAAIDAAAAIAVVISAVSM